MAGNISHKLKNAFEGALAGGGDPATSPLYVFGPFLKLLVLGVAANALEVSFGASIWLVVITIGVVSAMYRLVMQWVTDGSGGSGLSEEEFGSWAVKINAAITFIEYTLTFLVSMAAMVTFIADRFQVLNQEFLWMQYRDIIAVLLSVLVGYLVNRGPKMAARIFGPATAGVLALLWAMVIATIWQRGFHLPDFNLLAFHPDYLMEFTIGGYVRILAVMTGIEVFANLVAAYDGEPAQRSRKAFNSLLIIMGTTAITMLIVGPAIRDIADLSNTEVSVFTQTMDALLPAPLPLLGTIVGIAVLMSASAAAAQGLQNLALGLTKRRYIPPALGEQNRFEVADKPVWIQVIIVAICFIFIGTHEETYLAIYAAGVFILLSMTGWAVTKRLFRMARENFKISVVGLIAGTILASILTTIATVIIFVERFAEGAWTYLVFIPLLYVFFSYSRNRLGEPSDAVKYLARLDMSQLAGFGFGQSARGLSEDDDVVEKVEISWQPEPIEKSEWRDQRIKISQIATLLDGSDFAAEALPYVKTIAKGTGAKLTILSAIKNHSDALMASYEENVKTRKAYLEKIADELRSEGIDVQTEVRPGFIADATRDMIDEHKIDLVVTSTRGKSGNPHWLTGGVSSKLMRAITTPVLLVQGAEATSVDLDKLLVALDGSIFSERVLPYARALAQAMKSEVTLLSVPEVPEVANYRAPSNAYSVIREQAEANMANFLDAVSRSLREDGINVNTMTEGSRPVQTIVEVSKKKDADVILMTSRGRGGLDLLFMGSVAERVVEEVQCAVLMVPIHDRLD